MTAEWIKQPAVVQAYGLKGTESFGDVFSTASMESILFYVFAFAVWSLEKLFDMHSDEVDRRIEQLEPHTLRWYVSKAKGYMHDWTLATDADYYEIPADKTAEEVEAAKVVKYAVATESNTVVYLKVAGRGHDGNPVPLTEAKFKGLCSYINEVKDAGVSVHVRNEPADMMRVSLLICYDPTLLSESGGSYVLSDGSDPVRETVQGVITGLPFNGVFRKSDLMAALQALPCVKAVDIKKVEVKTANGTEWSTVEAFCRPYSGYYTLADKDGSNLLTVNYESYETLDNVSD